MPKGIEKLPTKNKEIMFCPFVNVDCVPLEIGQIMVDDVLQTTTGLIKVIHVCDNYLDYIPADTIMFDFKRVVTLLPCGISRTVGRMQFGDKTHLQKVQRITFAIIPNHN